MRMSTIIFPFLATTKGWEVWYGVVAVVMKKFVLSMQSLHYPYVMRWQLRLLSPGCEWSHFRNLNQPQTCTPLAHTFGRQLAEIDAGDVIHA